MNTPWKKILASLVGPLALTALALTTAPGAQAAPQAGAAAQGTVWEIWNNYNGLFLTDDGFGTGQGDVYAAPGTNRSDQLWHERAGYRRSNASTGYCLWNGSDHGDEWNKNVHTFGCGDGTHWRQQWFHYSHPGGVVIKTWDNYCLTSGDRVRDDGGRDVWLEPCRATKTQLWSVRPVF
ncbi:ricin-type beta-trefoil lectin domain protein [Streptomyces lomondensis]|uniref:Ricin B lectin domain-containing protein n=1 Tax=Streptomyces lomondensis TaxID=68229 RepID=A0ABQ2XTF1_9ACTN|nr:ricin-type beta-trefoil lectin domain protein [Streptomyces lomondensis]MCF0082713.1 ricin-type beta-trefoil lectin domain protein [Streptomyces lomondensis]GGX32234.1 hypothetical protein GCM10010383_73170 [Streptomyces lomondensis]